MFRGSHRPRCVRFVVPCDPLTNGVTRRIVLDAIVPGRPEVAEGTMLDAPTRIAEEP